MLHAYTRAQVDQSKEAVEKIRRENIRVVVPTNPTKTRREKLRQPYKQIQPKNHQKALNEAAEKLRETEPESSAEKKTPSCSRRNHQKGITTTCQQNLRSL